MINLWHSILKMPKHDALWHKQDMEDEFKELEEAEGFFDTWSELSDVVYTYTRARWSGHKHFYWPLSRMEFIKGIFYMIPKYTLRWLFFRLAGKMTDKKSLLREVRNPRKSHKLKTIAQKHGLNSDEFEKQCKRLLKIWPLIK